MHKFRNSSTEDSNTSFLDCILPLSYRAQYISAFMVSKDVSLIAISAFIYVLYYITQSSDNPPILSVAPFIQLFTTSASTCAISSTWSAILSNCDAINHA